jgi:hypothetical protein
LSSVTTDDAGEAVVADANVGEVAAAVDGIGADEMVEGGDEDLEVIELEEGCWGGVRERVGEVEELEAGSVLSAVETPTRSELAERSRRASAGASAAEKPPLDPLAWQLDRATRSPRQGPSPMAPSLTIAPALPRHSVAGVVSTAWYLKERRQEGHEEEESTAAHVGCRLVTDSRLPLRAACACLLHHRKWKEA